MPASPTVVEAKRAAEGASAIVYRARLADGSIAACKVAKQGFEQVLVGEAERIAWLDDPALPRLLGAGRWERGGPQEGAPYLLSPWIEGASLDPLRLRARRSETRSTLAAHLAHDVAAALWALERVGISHGDLKPSNVLIKRAARGPRAHVIDLGLGGGAMDASITGGTPRYLAPEARAGAVLERRFLDRYALGVMLAELLCREAAQADDPREALASSSEPGKASPLGALTQALLSPSPLARPGPAHVMQVARRLLGDAAPPLYAEGRVKAAYVGVRRAALAAAGDAQDVLFDDVASWAPELVARLRAARALRTPSEASGTARLSPLDAAGLCRWLSALVGPAAAAWPLASLGASEARLGEALLRLARSHAPEAWTFEQLRAALDDDEPARHDEPLDFADPAALALALAAPRPSEATLAAAETALAHHTSPALQTALLDALRRRGEPERALLLVSDDAPAPALAAAAEAARRVRAPALARSLIARSLSLTPSPTARRRALAIEARLGLDEGAPREALAKLPPRGQRDAAASEVAALALAALGQLDEAAAEAEAGLSAASDDEGRARLAGTAGYVAHARGDARSSLAWFREAAQAAARAGATLEEATYRTGEAAASIDAGALSAGLDAANRAAALWEALGRRTEAARALLSAAAGLRIAGALSEATALANEAASSARLAGDRRAEGYALLVLVDAGTSVEQARAWLTSAEPLLSPSPSDLLRVRARQLQHHLLSATAIVETDQLASLDESTSTARLEWWALRAAQHLAHESPGRRQDCLSALLMLDDAQAPIELRGRASDAGRRLAQALGDGAAARRLALNQRAAAWRLLEGCAPEHRASLLATPWLSDVSQATTEAPVSSGQVNDLLSLVRALSSRDKLRPLLEQILDALILWTGVERGLLLMPAPNGKLQPRAARNLSHDDLRGEQLSLSQSLARRALSEQRPVVAVDAAGESHDVYASVHALKLRSVLAVPLIARGAALGVVYLDDRVRRGAFGPDEIAWVGLLASIAAVALADARDQVLLRRAARKARRAQEALTATLAHKEAELDAIERAMAQTPARRGMRFRYDEIVGASDALQETLRLVDRVAPSDVPVLLQGETGSGKELFARAIHRNSQRSRGRFLSENCAAIPEPLLETTLFGHAKGAFTGAIASRSGLFELAHGGTLFLDEIGEMSLAMQSRLLRVLQDGEVRPIGGQSSRKVDVRVITATHRDLAAMVREGRFREDLYYRLRVIEIRLPSLRQRPSDIPLLVHHFIQKHAGGRKVRVTQQAMSRLLSFAWPGNVRQLENVVRHALVLSDGEIDKSCLPSELATGPVVIAQQGTLSLRERIEVVERELIREALRRTAGNQSKAAELLGVSRFGLQKMLKRLQLND